MSRAAPHKRQQARYLFLAALCFNLGNKRSTDVHALVVRCDQQPRASLFPSSTSSSAKCRVGTRPSTRPTADTGARVRPPASLLAMQQTSGNWEEYFRGGGSSGDGGSGGRGERGAATTGSRDRGRGRGRGGGRERDWVERSGGGGAGGESVGREGRRRSSESSQYSSGRSSGGDNGSGGRSDFGRGRGRGRGRGASVYNDGAARYSGRSNPGTRTDPGRGRSSASRKDWPGYNTDDFEVLEEGTGDDGSWDNFRDFSDDPALYEKSRGADTADVEDLGTELRVVTRAGRGGFPAVPAAETVFSTDPNLSPVSGGQGLGRSNNRERRSARRELRRREESSDKGRREGGRLWSEDDGAAGIAAAAAEAAKVRDGAQLRIKRREQRENEERERQAAYFASLDRQGDGAPAGGGGTDGGLDDILGEYFSPDKASAPPTSSPTLSPLPKQRRFAQNPPRAESSSGREDQLPPASSTGGRGRGRNNLERSRDYDSSAFSPSERAAEGPRGGSYGSDDYGAVRGQRGGGHFGRQAPQETQPGRGGSHGRGRDDLDRYGKGGGGSASASYGGMQNNDGGGRVLDKSIWDADRWESTGSTAWFNAGDGDGAGGRAAGGRGRGALPSWKVAKVEPEPEPETTKLKSAPIPDWLPQQGGLGKEARRGVAPLPKGIDTSVKKLGIKGLEAMLRAKFSNMKDGMLTTAEDDGIDYYDPDDEGYERPEDGQYLPLVKSGGDVVDPGGGTGGVDAGAAVQDYRGAVRYDDRSAPRPKGSGLVARSEAEAAGGGFRMRSPSRAAAAAATANTGGDGDPSPVLARDGDNNSNNKSSPLAASSNKRGRVDEPGGGSGGGSRSRDGFAGSPMATVEGGGTAAGAGRGLAEVQDKEKDGVAGGTGREKKAKSQGESKPSLTPVNIADMETIKQQDSVSFWDLGIQDERLLENVKKLGIESPTDVQVSAIRGLLSEDKDVIIHAHTGSGKTLAYLLPLISTTDPGSNAVQAIVVAPGRELASQIFSVCEKLIEGSGLRSAMIIGGANALRQVERVKKVKPQIVIATPGRLCELVFDRRRMKLGMVRTVVLDEVDALLRPPYDQEIDAIMDATPGGVRPRQAVFASATGRSPVVTAASKRYMREGPLFVGGDEGVGKGSGQRRSGLPPNIRHTIVTMPKPKKFDTLRRLLNTQPFPESVMIFVNDPIQVNWLTERLETVGIIAAPLSGESSKDDRAEIMRRLQDKRITMVVTTEMAARGLDVAHLTHVVNYDLPTDADHYVHRAGRCGRAGRPGIVVSMATPDVKFVLGKFARSLGVRFDDCEIQGGRFWAVSSTEPPAVLTAKAGIGAGGGATTAVDVGGVVDEMSAEPPPPPRRTSPVDIDRGFLGDPMVGSKSSAGVMGENEDSDAVEELVLGMDVDIDDDDMLAEAKAAAGAAASAAGRRDKSSSQNGAGGDADSVSPAGGKRVQTKSKEETAPASASASRGLEMFAVAGGLTIINTPPTSEEFGFEDEAGVGSFGFDEDDWGDGDWGDSSEEEDEKEDDNDDDDEGRDWDDGH